MKKQEEMAMTEKNKRYAFFLGCTVPVRTQGYELSTRAVATALDIELVDLDFNCCGYPLNSLDLRTAQAISLRNLAVAEIEDVKEICTLCSGCGKQLEQVNCAARNDSEFLSLLNKGIAGTNYNYKGTVRVRHFARILYEDITTKRISELTANRLRSFKVAAYYGCHYIRPVKVTGATVDLENPSSLDSLIEATGAFGVEYWGKDKCCGGSLVSVDQAIAFAISRKRLAAIRESKPDAIVLVCPFCGMMLENAQKEIPDDSPAAINIPVLYYPQLLGLALNLPVEQLGLNLNDKGIANLLSKL